MSIPVVVPIEGEAPITPTTSNFQSVEPEDAASRSQCYACRPLARKLFELLEFHTLNAALGLGGGILTWVLLPLSVLLLPLFGFGLVVFRFMLVVLARLARHDVELATRQCPYNLKLHSFVGNEATNLAVTSTAWPPTKTSRVVFYFAVPKFLIGALSGAAAAWTVEQPLLAIVSAGYNDVLGITTFESDAVLYVAILLGCMVSGAISCVLVPKVSVPLTAWACCDLDFDKEAEVYWAAEQNQPPSQTERRDDDYCSVSKAQSTPV
ncbi:hypothetical protein PHYPSEUDO_001041 [Phytophthora pseudosyringae]|uniref:Transmembrane protein n=1 Tax=Phytophthora pseudosyringae TaxID=221518 RepID=A0A8T1VXX3_9STRA|nr:hypothetical protein PHYPSEUDO_001041 [Phytophthora pseudosyringae]